MSLEANLPENIRRRLDRQVSDADADVSELRGLLEFAEKAQPVEGGPHRLRTQPVDPVTLHTARLLVKCLRADLAYAIELAAAARRVRTMEFGFDPDEGEAQEDPNDYIGNGWIGSDGRP